MLSIRILIMVFVATLCATEMIARRGGAAEGITSLDLIIDCSASGKAVDWINTASLQCSDDRYDTLANQTGPNTLRAYFRSVPPGESCQLLVGSGFDSKILGTIALRGSPKKRIQAKCAW